MTDRETTQMKWKSVAGNQDGVVMLTTMLVMVILAIIGIASITMSTMENRMAGFLRTGESSVIAAESCLNVGVNVIQQTIDFGTVPSSFWAVPTPAGPAGPIPNANVPVLQAEIMGQSDGNPDVPDISPPAPVAGVPNIVVPTPGQTVGSFTVQGDIDRLYVVPKAGAAMQFAAGYEGTGAGAAGGGVDILYQLDCRSANVATGTTARVTAIYACTATGESCQRKI